MSPTRTELCRWLATIDVKGTTLDIGGKVWSMRNKVKSFDGEYFTFDESDGDLNSSSFLPFDLYDNVFCTEVMQFLYAPDNALYEIYASLKSGGNLYLSFHLTHPPMKDHDYLRYTEKGIRKLLLENTFEIQQFTQPIDGYFLVKCSRQ